MSAVTKYLSAASLFCWCEIAKAQHRTELTRSPCLLCDLELRIGFDFLVGLALLGGLIWLLQWLESATLPAIAENLFGVVVTGFVLFFLLR